MNLEEALGPIRAKLQTAVEVELTTIPPYLMAMYSIKEGYNVVASNLIRSVFMEEMLHMILAANILSAIGGKLSLGRENIPVYPCRLKFNGVDFRDREFDVNLAPLSKESLDTFMQIELPAFLDNEPDVAGFDHIEVTGYTIGEFYQDIVTELTDACELFGEENVFHGDPSFQVSEEYYWKGEGKPVVVRSLDNAKAAIDIIVEQGEGAEIDLLAVSAMFFKEGREVPHYFRFKEIHAERHFRPGDNPKGHPTGPEFPVDYGGVYPLKSNCKAADFVDNPQLLHLNRLFNSNYSMMLSQIAEGFNGNPAVFYTAILNGMRNLTPIARQMVQIPIPGDPENRHAAPSYEWIDDT